MLCEDHFLKYFSKCFFTVISCSSNVSSLLFIGKKKYIESAFSIKQVNTTPGNHCCCVFIHLSRKDALSLERLVCIQNSPKSVIFTFPDFSSIILVSLSEVISSLIMLNIMLCPKNFEGLKPLSTRSKNIFVKGNLLLSANGCVLKVRYLSSVHIR